MLLRRRQALLAGLLPLVPRAASAEEPATLSADAQARWIAGLAPHPTLAPSAEWAAYAKTEDERWQATRARVKAMEDWAAHELVPVMPKDPVLFYPFAGPDVLSASALFGGARRLLLVGLEPVGTLPDPASGAVPVGFFSRLGAALADVHRLTFFRTQEMASDFRQDGVLGALVATIARLGHRVTRIVVQAAAAGASARARVEWTDWAGAARRLEYVQADLANAGLKAQPSLVASIHGLAPCVTFLKAAMYLLPEARFSTLRQAILDDSAVVVQDDTGMPFRSFDARWAVRAFGRYETPGAPYESRLQPDLRAVFERRAPAPLPFGIGYHVDPRRSNLLVASKGGGA